MKNYGGDGKSMENARVFKLIEAGEIDEDLTMAMDLQLYHKQNEEKVWELHGNLILTGSDESFKSKTTRFGWFFSNTITNFDGLAVEFNWGTDVFTGQDIWHAGEPDIENNKVESLGLDADNNWIIVDAKSEGKVSCNSTSCTLKAHF